MCISGCHPKRAGSKYFNELYKKPNQIYELAKKHGLMIDVTDLNLDTLLKQGIRKDEDLIKWLKQKITKDFFYRKGFQYQGGCVLFVGDMDLEGSNAIISTLISFIQTICEELQIGPRILGKRYQELINPKEDGLDLKLIFAFSPDDRIDSYLLGDESFSFPQIFVGVNPGSLKCSPDARIINIVASNQVKKILEPINDRNGDVTPCLFCDKPVFGKVKQYYQKMGFPDGIFVVKCAE